MSATDIRSHLARGHVIPAHPLALTAARTLDERHQRALTRYYMAAGAGGIALVQHLASAAYPAMPEAAARQVPSARALAPGDVAPFLARLSAPRSVLEPLP